MGTGSGLLEASQLLLSFLRLETEDNTDDLELSESSLSAPTHATLILASSFKISELDESIEDLLGSSLTGEVGIDLLM